MSEPSQSVSLFEDPERATRPNLQTPDPLPMSREEIERRGWDEVDVVFITGDAYVDSPSFANGLLARVLPGLHRQHGVPPRLARPRLGLRARMHRMRLLRGGVCQGREKLCMKAGVESEVF